MKKILLFLFIGMQIMSCQKQNIAPNPPNEPDPLPSDTTSLDSSFTLKGQTWVLTAYRIGEFGPIINKSDTVCFLTNQAYTYNNFSSTYSFFPTMSSYNLTLNETFLGDLSGSIYTYNLLSGQIEGNKFTNITLGSSNGDFYLWLNRI